MTDLNRLTAEIVNLRKHTKAPAIEERKHCEPYLWRIFLFDNTAYVSAYLHRKDNDSKSVVYRIQRANGADGGPSLFTVFDRYFDYLWMKYDPDPRAGAARWAVWE